MTDYQESKTTLQNLNDMIVKAYDVILYDGSKLHFEVMPSDRFVKMKPKDFENKVLDNLANQLDKSNPPCKVNFKFG